MKVTTYQRGILKGREEGIEKGIEKGCQLTLLEALKEEVESKFDSEGTRWYENLPADLPVPRLKELNKLIRTARSIGDLESLAR